MRRQGGEPLHYACPRNGEPTRCKVRECGKRQHPHRVEVLAQPWHKQPRCDTHQIPLVLV